MNFERYSRQITLTTFGAQGQNKLQAAKVLVVGAGGLGVPVLSYLNAMGVGSLGIVDADIVSYSNLHRQVLYTEAMVGEEKVAAAKKQLAQQNSETKITLYPTFLNVSNALEIISNYDLVVDATDNFAARYLINDACVIQKKPFVYGALHGFEGQVSVFNYNNGPTYRCLFPVMPKENELPNCDQNGVLGILPGIVGNLQALEAVKIIGGLGSVLSGTLLLYDALSQEIRKMRFSLQEQNIAITKLAASYGQYCEVAKIPSISAKEFKDTLQQEQVCLLDVRSLEEFSTSHLNGAIHIPLQALAFRSQELTANKVVYVVCESGKRSINAIEMLAHLLPKTTFINVSGGMQQIRLS